MKKTSWNPKDYVTFSEKNYRLISSTPAKECWICDELVKHTIQLGSGKVGIEKKWLESEGFKEHLSQLLRKVI
jgi:hypothetical protein